MMMLRGACEGLLVCPHCGFNVLLFCKVLRIRDFCGKISTLWRRLCGAPELMSGVSVRRHTHTCNTQGACRLDCTNITTITVEHMAPQGRVRLPQPLELLLTLASHRSSYPAHPHVRPYCTTNAAALQAPY